MRFDIKVMVFLCKCFVCEIIIYIKCLYVYKFLSYRYQKDANSSNAPAIPLMSDYQFTSINIFKELFNLHNQKEPTELSNRIANIGIALLCEFAD